MTTQGSELLDLTERLVRIPTTQDKPDSLIEALDLVKTELPDYQFTEFSRENSVGNPAPSIVFSNRKIPSDTYRVLLHGHLDVVPAQHSDQFTPTKDGNRLYGRGTHDMKAAAAVMIQVFGQLAEEVSYPLGLALTTDEEVGGINGAKYQVEQGVEADFVISGEPTNLAIGNQHKGLLTLQLHAETHGGHTAYDGEDRNALLQLMGVQLAAVAMYPSPNEIWRTSCVPTITATSNRANNVVPADATGRLSVRYVPQDNPEAIRQAIAEIDPRVSVERFGLGSSAHFTDPNHPDIEALSRAIESVTKESAALQALPHSSDVTHWTEVGSAAVDFGPNGAGLHTEEEFVEIDSLKIYADILTAYLRSLEA